MRRRRRNRNVIRGTRPLRMGRSRPSLAQRVRKIMSKEQEYKVHDHPVNTAPNTAGTISYVSGIAQSDTNDGRDGNSVTVTSIRLLATMESSSSSTGPTLGRLILFIDRTNTGATPAVSDVLFSAGTTTVRSLPTIVNKSRFRILFDSMRYDGPTNNTDDLSVQAGKILTYYKKFDKGIELKYTGTTFNVADAQKNPMFLLYISNASTNLPAFQGTLRLRYTDS